MRKSNKKKVLALLAASAILLSSCTQNDTIDKISTPNIVTFLWWGNDYTHNYTNSALDEFELQNPEINVIASYYEWSDFEKTLSAKMFGDNESDVMQISYQQLEKFSSDGKSFYDLSTLSNQIKLNNFTTKQLNFGTVNGNLLAIPISLDAPAFFYNETIYEHYNVTTPKNWDDLFYAASVMSPHEIYPLELDETAMWFTSLAYEEQHCGVQILNNKNKLAFNQGNLESMLTLYSSLVSNKVTKYADEIGINDFASGKSAGKVFWSTQADYYCTPAMEKGYSISTGKYVYLKGSPTFGWYAKPTALYAIKKDTKHAKDSATLVNFLLNSEEMSYNQGTDKGIPLSKSALEVLEANDLIDGISAKASENLMEWCDKMQKMYSVLESPEIISAYKSACDEIYYNNADISVAASQLYDDLNELLK